MGEAPVVGPVAGGERIPLWDVLRGFAVLGILLANIPFMAMAGAMTAPDWHFVGGDRAIDYISCYFVYVFADTKFVTIFSTLFGAGLALMYERAKAAGAPFVVRYSRRLLVLMLFGIVHGTLIWFGDILTMYSLIGFLAIVFRNCRVRTLLIWATALLLLNGLLWAAFATMDPAEWIELRTDEAGRVLSQEETIELDTADVVEVMSSGSFFEMAERRREDFDDALFFMSVLFGMRTLALFLLGMVLVRCGAMMDPGAHRAFFRRLAVLGIPVGLVLMSVSTWAELQGESTGYALTSMTTLYVGGFALAYGYIGAVALWSMTSCCEGLRSRLAAVGRMALTSYLSHSVITGILFNYCGLYDQWRRPTLLLLVFGIFAFQLWISPIWLRHFRFGPAEWLWRSLTYSRPIPFRRARPAS